MNEIPAPPIGRFAGLLKTVSNIEPNEVRACVLSFLFIFILMAAYYLLRPLRDAMASDWSDAEVSLLWTLNFFVSTALVAIWGYAVTRLRFSWLVPFIYLFFAASFAGFYYGTQAIADRVLVDKGFYLWVSVFALFNVSVFWSFMADVFNKQQSKRLFGVITAGASLGAVVGPLLAAVLANTVSIDAMMLVAAIMLLFPMPIIVYLQYLKRTALDNASLEAKLASKKIGGLALSGFREFLQNPYLLGIGLFIILYTGVGSFVYFEQKNLLEHFTREQRSSIYAYRDVVVNVLTYVLAFFLTGRLVTKLGMPTALALVPLLLIAGMLTLAFSPVLLAALGMHVALRAGNYGLTRPAREMLFTSVSREQRFKAKPVIDIVAYRGGDVIMGWFFTALSSGIGLGLAAIAAVGAGLAGIWALIAVLLGRSFEKREPRAEPHGLTE